MEDSAAPQQYVGFWARSLAMLVDSLVFGIALAPVLGLLARDPGLMSLDAADLADPEAMSLKLGAIAPDLAQSELLQLIAVGVLCLVFWIWRSATPGKIIISAVVVDARTLGKPSAGQFVVRYLGYYLSLVFGGLGFLWIAFDGRKQGWHDKLAGTVVIKKRT